MVLIHVRMNICHDQTVSKGFCGKQSPFWPGSRSPARQQSHDKIVFPPHMLRQFLPLNSLHSLHIFAPTGEQAVLQYDHLFMSGPPPEFSKERI